MRAIPFVTCVIGVFVLMVGALEPSAASDRLAKARSQMRAYVKAGLASFDGLDYEVARDRLAEAVVFAKRNGLARESITAQAYIALGIVDFSGFNNSDGAKLHFLDAVAIDPKIEIPPEYKTASMNMLLKLAKREHQEKSQAGQKQQPDCAILEGISHSPPGPLRSGKPASIRARVGGREVDAMFLYYRSKATGSFRSTPMRNTKGCEFAATIPGRLMSGSLIHYYIAAKDKKGRMVVSVGSLAKPNVIELVEKLQASSSNFDRWSLRFGMGTSAAYAVGETEQQGEVIDCCVVTGVLHTLAEVGYYLKPQLRLALAVRLGFTIGANRPGKASSAIAGLVRVYYALSPSQSGLELSVGLGGGFLRYVSKIEGPAASDGDTDTVASGPLLMGGGVHYTLPVNKTIRLIAEIQAITGLPIGTVGGVTGQFGIGVDANLGVGFLF